ncbi:hypothetical protein P7C70_g3306, partial [Phenoliferia sp. Uapishka_3]
MSDYRKTLAWLTLCEQCRKLVWKTFQTAFATAGPRDTTRITSLVRHNNYKNAQYPSTPDREKNAFHAHKAFCKVATLFCEPDPHGPLPTLYNLPDSSTNEALRQLALCYWLLHHFQRRGHFISDEESKLLFKAYERLCWIADEMTERGEEGGRRFQEIGFMWGQMLLPSVREKMKLQRTTGDPGPGEGQTWMLRVRQ